jgi:ribosomal protein L33
MFKSISLNFKKLKNGNAFPYRASKGKERNQKKVQQIKFCKFCGQSTKSKY